MRNSDDDDDDDNNNNNNNNSGEEILGIRRKIVELKQFCFVSRNNSLSYLVKNLNLR